MLQRRLILACVFILAVALPLHAQPLRRAKAPEDVGLSSERLKRLSTTMQAAVDKGELPGVAVVIARQGQVAFGESWGFRDREAGTPMALDSIHRIASMTKPITSLAAMMLVEEGRIGLADPVFLYLPEFKESKVGVEKKDDAGPAQLILETPQRPMTVQDLLRHTAGLAYGEITTNSLVKSAYTKASLFKADFDYNTTDLTAEEFVQRLAQAPLAYAPGTTWEYSLAVDVLGRVVEKASGKRLGEFLEERLFKPVQMTDTAFSVPQDKASRLAEPLPIDPATGSPNRLIDVRQPPKNDSGGAGAVSTASDYLRFGQMMLNGGELDGARVLSRTTVALMTSDHLPPTIRQTVQPGEQLLGVQGYTFGLGFAVRKEQGLAGLHGSAGEFTWGGYAGTYFWIDPKEQLVGVLMTQAPGPSRAYYRRMMRALTYQAIAD